MDTKRCAIGCIATTMMIEGPDLMVAEDHFRQALDHAHREVALSWELRAGTSLARLLRETVQNVGVITPVVETDSGPKLRRRHAQGGASHEPFDQRAMDRPVALDRKGGMKWRVMVELAG